MCAGVLPSSFTKLIQLYSLIWSQLFNKFIILFLSLFLDAIDGRTHKSCRTCRNLLTRFNFLYTFRLFTLISVVVVGCCLFVYFFFSRFTHLNRLWLKYTLYTARIAWFCHSNSPTSKILLHFQNVVNAHTQTHKLHKSVYLLVSSTNWLFVLFHLIFVNCNPSNSKSCWYIH